MRSGSSGSMKGKAPSMVCDAEAAGARRDAPQKTAAQKYFFRGKVIFW